MAHSQTAARTQEESPTRSYQATAGTTQLALDGTPADPLDDIVRLRELYVDEDMSLQDVSEELGYHQTTIRDCLLKYGIPVDEARSGGPHSHDSTPMVTTAGGYTAWVSAHRFVLVHRLVAVAHHGMDAAWNREVHHSNYIPFDNRPANLELVTSAQHRCIHARESALTEDRQNHELTEYEQSARQTKLNAFV